MSMRKMWENGPSYYQHTIRAMLQRVFGRTLQRASRLIEGRISGIIAVLALVATALQAYIANDTEKRSLRAYVGVVSKPDALPINQFFTDLKPLVTLKVRNFGSTPAYKVTYKGTLVSRPYPIPKYANLSTPELPVGNPIMISPGEYDIRDIIIPMTDKFTKDDLTSITGGVNRRLFTWGEVHYTDAFGYKHRTNFCFSFFYIPPTAIYSFPCDEHNDAD